MITAEEREKSFRDDLAILLAKHKAEIDITDDGKGYGMQSGIVEVTMRSEWDDDGNQTAEYADFTL